MFTPFTTRANAFSSMRTEMGNVTRCFTPFTTRILKNKRVIDYLVFYFYTTRVVNPLKDKNQDEQQEKKTRKNKKNQEKKSKRQKRVIADGEEKRGSEELYRQGRRANFEGFSFYKHG